MRIDVSSPNQNPELGDLRQAADALQANHVEQALQVAVRQPANLEDLEEEKVPREQSPRPREMKYEGIVHKRVSERLHSPSSQRLVAEKPPAKASEDEQEDDAHLTKMEN